MTDIYDVIVVGAGTPGIPATIYATERGARVLLVEQAGDVGGTMHVSSGQISAAGTKLQKAKGIGDTPDLHFDDIIRISRGRVDKTLVRLAVDLTPSTVDWLTDLGADFDPAPRPLSFAATSPIACRAPIGASMERCHTSRFYGRYSTGRGPAVTSICASTPK